MRVHNLKKDGVDGERRGNKKFSERSKITTAFRKVLQRHVLRMSWEVTMFADWSGTWLQSIAHGSHNSEQ